MESPTTRLRDCRCRRDGRNGIGSSTYRHGTLSLSAAHNRRASENFGHTAPRRTSQAFVDFLENIVASQPRRRESRVIIGHLSAHKTKAVAAFLDAHPRLHLHYTPTYWSQLNQVRLSFGKIKAV